MVRQRDRIFDYTLNAYFNLMINLDYYAGIPTPTPKDVIRAYEFGILKPETAYTLLEGVLGDHDHKENCDCYSFYQTLKEIEKDVKDEAVDLELNHLLGK